MRSAETSGVEAKRFHAQMHGATPEFRLTRLLFGPLQRLLHDMSPMSRAVALTALLAAGLYCAVELIGEFDQPSGPVTMLALAGTAALPEPQVDLGGVGLRGLGAFGLAFALTALAYRRRGLAGLVSDDELERYAELVNSLPFGVACWTDEARLIVCNSRFIARLGIGRDLDVGTSYAEVVRDLSQGGYTKRLREDDGTRLLELHRNDGSTHLIEEKPLGRGGFVTLVTDITESRRTSDLLVTIREEQRDLARRYHEEKLKAEAASRSKTTFLAHLSHDIRTPLNHIIGFADLLKQQPFGPLGDQRYLDYVEAVKGSGDRLLGFFGSILELAELEGGRRELKRDRFTADELLVQVLRRFSNPAQRAGITLGLGGACEAVLAADRFALDRMVSNLVENAIRYTPRGGKVTLAAYAAEDGVVLEVTDTGTGIAPERLDALSQPFAFGDAALTRDREGAGLGVAISRAIAEVSGGHLAIDSRQGLGTTVAVSLPIVRDEQAKAA